MSEQNTKIITVEIDNYELDALENYFLYYYTTESDKHMLHDRLTVINLWQKLVNQFDKDEK